MLPAGGDPARGIMPLHIAAGMSCVPDPRHSEQGAVGVCAIHCDSYHTSKYNINSSQYRSTIRFVLWRPRCNVRALIPHMLPVTVHCNVVYALKVTVLGTVWKLNSSHLRVNSGYGGRLLQLKFLRFLQSLKIC